MSGQLNIINLPIRSRPQMSMEDRAAQFAPFRCPDGTLRGCDS